MKERPLLFRTPLVRAILDGRKSQTRRAMKSHAVGRECPYGVPGDRLWVREAWQQLTDRTGRPDGMVYRADDEQPGLPLPGPRWRAGIFLRRQHARIILEITEVRVQRLQDITDADAAAEGVGAADTDWTAYRPRAAFRDLWNRIHGDESWHANPYVWALTFRRLQP